MPAGNGVSRSVKPMRLGTKSCSECRRRKVRCIFSGNSTSCTACQLHGTLCRPQGLSGTPQASNAPGKEPRLDKLESLLSLICNAAGIPLDLTANGCDLETSVIKLVGQLQSSRDSNSSDLGTKDALAFVEHIGADHDKTVEDGDILKAPLMEYIGNTTMLVDRSIKASVRDIVPQSSDILNEHRESIQKLLPIASDISQILESTKKYWALWPLHPNHLVPSESLSVSVVSIAQSFIEESIRSNEPAIIARAMMWLALCIQQIPKGSIGYLSSVRYSATELVLAYVEAAEVLLNLASRSGYSITGLICLVLQAKCYVNMGRPRKAWMSIRRALSQALLQGFHEPKGRHGKEAAHVWATIWGFDCQLSLILGVPHGISEYHSDLITTPSSGSNEATIMHRITLVCGRINSRNQKRADISYTTTLQLDEELDGLRAMFPNDWWENTGAENLTLEDFHTRQTLKMYFFQLKQLTHLPYMLKATSDRKYEYSRISVFEAIEGMIRCYEDRQMHSSGAYVMCFLVDFFAFSAGLIMATDLLSQNLLWTRDAEEKKWKLILGLISQLKYAASLLDHTVASQGAQLLEYLYSSRHGIYEGPDTYEAVIPYFGKVCIRRPQQKLPTESSPDLSDPRTKDWTNTVAFGSNIFDFGSFTDVNTNDLDMDWTAILDEQMTYNWNVEFEF